MTHRLLRSAWIAPAIVLLAAVALRIADPPMLDDARLRVFDAFQRARPRPAAEVPVAVVDIDDDSLARLGQWPWPRSLLAELVTELTRRGAAVIAFDILFAEPDRTSPSRLHPESAALPDHDRLLAQAFAMAPVVTGFALTSGSPAVDRLPLLRAGFAHAGDDPSPHLLALPGSVLTLPGLEEAAKGNGHVTILAERDGITRRVPLVLRHGDRLYPSLTAEALRVAQGASTYVIKTSGASGERDAGSKTGLVSIKIGSIVVPTDQHGRAWLYSAPPSDAHRVPAWTVLAGQLDPEALRGQIVYVGTSATGLKDIRATALDSAAAGVTIHEQLTTQMLTGQFLQRPDWADGAELVYLVLLGLAMIVLLPRAGALACAGLGAGTVALACGLSWYAFAAAHWLLDPVMPSLAALAIYLVGSFVNFRSTEAQRRQVRDAFGRYLSPLLVERLAQHPEQLRLGGESKTMTILFADIRGFTRISEQLDAQQLTQLLNRFFTPMTAVIMERQGTIDKYIGDCIMAFWNAPLDDPQHARHACDAALAMRERLARWNAERVADAAASTTAPVPVVQVGIGINTGTCCVGNLGSDQRFDYSVLGDSVNLAARLEELTKLYTVDIVLGESTAALVDDYALLELDAIIVRGRSQPVRMFALLGDAQMAGRADVGALRDAHQQMLAAYRARRWDEAMQWIDRCDAMPIERLSLRMLYAVYRERIAAYRATPPPQEWAGIFIPPAR